MESDNHVKDSLDLLSKRWSIDPEVYDLHLGRRNDVVDTAIGVNGVVFHIPTLVDDNLYVLWKCIWPDCHNCCELQGRLPLTKDDIKIIAKKMGYVSESEFIRTETRISSWEQQKSVDKVLLHLQCSH